MENNDNEQISQEEVWSTLEFAEALYRELKGFPVSDFYNPQMENKTLIDLNNNPKVPTLESLRNAIANYKFSGEELKDYSEFMTMWDGIYKMALDYKLNLLSFDINRYCVNIKDNSEYNSQEYLDDVKRVNKFFQNFNAKQEFRDVTKNMLIGDAYFCWLRDSMGSFDEEAITLENETGYKTKRGQSFSLQMMPQKHCKITGEFIGKGSKGFLWDFDINYFQNAQVNILNYDPSLIEDFNTNRNNGRLKSYIVDNPNELNKINSYGDSNYIRTKVNKGAWCFKYDTSNFNIIPPFAYLLKSVFNNDVIERLQKDKDIISANAIILGEMKTRDKETLGNNKNAFTIDPKQVGTLMKLARNGINKNIKQIALPLEETRLYQFADNNSNMYKNQLSTNAGLAGHNSSVIFTTEKLAQEEAQIASTIDYNSIANNVYPQFENFLNFFVNKKTKKYKFKFKVTGSTLPFLRQKDIDNNIKFIDKGLPIPPQRIATLLGYDIEEYECYLKEAQYGDMKNLMLQLNNSTSSTSNNVGNPIKEVEDLADGGATAREYL